MGFGEIVVLIIIFYLLLFLARVIYYFGSIFFWPIGVIYSFGSFFCGPFYENVENEEFLCGNEKLLDAYRKVLKSKEELLSVFGELLKANEELEKTNEELKEGTTANGASIAGQFLFFFILFGGCFVYTKNAISKIRQEAQAEKLKLEKEFEKRLIQPQPSAPELEMATLCSVCLDHPREILFRPCNHFCVCKKCRDILKTGNNKCPICMRKISSDLKVYFS